MSTSTCLQNGPALLEGGDLQEVVSYVRGLRGQKVSDTDGHVIAVADRYKVSRQVVHLRLEQLTMATDARQIGGVGRLGRALLWPRDLVGRHLSFGR